MLGHFREILYISILRTLFYNFFSQHIHRKKGYIVVYRRAKIYFEKGAKIEIANGNLFFGRCLGIKRDSSLRMQKNSRLFVYGPSIIEYGADILLKQNGVLSLDKNSYINCNVMIRCHEKISIGRDGYFASGVEVRDCDGHSIDGVLKTQPVSIGNHVWICSNVEILKGVTIDDGAVVGAKALVTSDIPQNTLSYGIPAKVHKENIKWE